MSSRRPFPVLHALMRRRVHDQGVAPVRCTVGLLSFLAAFEVLLWLRMRFEITDLPRVPYPGLTWLTPPPLELVTPIILVWSTAAFLFAFGVFVRATGTLSFVVAIYFLFCDQMLTTNHANLLALEVGLLTLAAWTRRGTTIAFWPLVLLKCLLSTVYAFAAVAKLNSDFLSGAVLGQAVGNSSLVPIPAALLGSSSLQIIGILLIATEIFLALGLWFSRTRRLAAVVGIALHTSVFFIFPHSVVNFVSFVQISGGMLALYPLFFITEAAED